MARNMLSRISYRSFQRFITCFIVGCLGSFAVHATVTQHTIQSKILQQVYQYQVSVPEGYLPDDNKKYPVLYVLEGDNHLDYTQAAARYLASVDAMPGVIIVAITNKARFRDFTPSEDSSRPMKTGGAASFLRFLHTELKPQIAADYAVAGYSMLSGHSLGGLFVVYAMSQPEPMFDAYFAYSPSMWWNNEALIKSLVADKNPLQHFNGLAYFTLADEKGKQLASFDAFINLLKTSQSKHFQWSQARFEREDHMTTPLVSQVSALRVAFADWLLTFEQVVEDPAIYQSFYQQQSKRYGMPITPPEWLIGQTTQHIITQLKDKKKAVVGSDVHLAMFPDSLWAYKGKADSHFLNGEQAQAIKFMEKAVKMAEQEENSYLDSLRETLSKMKAGTL